MQWQWLLGAILGSGQNQETSLNECMMFVCCNMYLMTCNSLAISVSPLVYDTIVCMPGNVFHRKSQVLYLPRLKSSICLGITGYVTCGASCVWVLLVIRYFPSTLEC